jgi:hypothetical protein
MQALANVAREHRDNTLTMLLRDFFNRQARFYAYLPRQHEWTQDQAEARRKEANTTEEQTYHLQIAHNALLNNELSERWLLKHCGLAVHVRAHVSAMLEAKNGDGNGANLPDFFALIQRRRLSPPRGEAWLHAGKEGRRRLATRRK